MSSGVLIKSMDHISLASSCSIMVELWNSGKLLTSGKIESYSKHTVTVNKIIYILRYCDILVV
jgi:hypothetical protein